MNRAENSSAQAFVLIRIILSAPRVRAYLSPPKGCPTLFEFVWERRIDTTVQQSSVCREPLLRVSAPVKGSPNTTRTVYTQMYRCSSSNTSPVIFQDYIKLPPQYREINMIHMISRYFWERILTDNIMFKNEALLNSYLNALEERYGQAGLPSGLIYRADEGCRFPTLPDCYRS